MTSGESKFQGSYRYTPERPYVEGERWDASVLNDLEHLTEQAQRLHAADDRGGITIEDLPWGYDVEESLRGYTVIPRWSIGHKEADNKPGEFDGWYMGEEYHGGEHPILLFSPDRVMPPQGTEG